MQEIQRADEVFVSAASILELALRLELPLATLDEDLQKAAKSAGVKKFA